MLVPVLGRSWAWILMGMLLVGCAAPTADWNPLRGQDGTQRKTDMTRCLSEHARHWGWDAADWVSLVLVGDGLRLVPSYDEAGIHQCMKGAGYEWAGPADVGEFWSRE